MKTTATRYSCDFLVIGSGIAGLCFAIHASRFGTVSVITKKEESESNTNYAQGGIACVLDPDDGFDKHIKDTLNAGCGLCNETAVSAIVNEGPERIKELIDWGVGFSRSSRAVNPYKLHLGKEGGHSRNRIVHAHDLTGKAVEEKLLQIVKADGRIRLFEHHMAIDLITGHHLRRTGEDRVSSRGPQCYGAYVLDTVSNSIVPVKARITCLASGGAGAVYLHTTNPAIATGDGYAIAYRAGAAIANMEFIQFHPTTLYHDHAHSFLISEALRGYGAELRDASGKKFMHRYHRMGSLAPRDIVARAIDSEIKLSGSPCVYLDIRKAPPAETRKHFPNIFKKCLACGVDITRELIPVVPAAHYLCGGIRVDLLGRTDIAGLYACGEVSCTGVHGANRLASNSLLEALVFSRRAAFDAGALRVRRPLMPDSIVPDWDDRGTIGNEEWILLSHNKTEIQTVMWDYVGIVRSDVRLERALRRITLLEKEIEDFYKRTRISVPLLELRNLVTTAKLIVVSAIKRKESRGLHFTTDYPERNDRYWKNDTVITRRAP
ncbi:MAG: L-aspartate oxidase [Chitinispirillaceae bacterium]|nr:L-aspartate oxidase [Chitinispirillaceae bacterium]